ncbi:Vacuolar protein sorting 20A (Vps20A) [Monocercomonoides exilis]|uniref:Vacuolar protein sorting 20A (Vps20A) n=1 Tax=Monocercomonoides exilis TaxID=2049356 RepID=UPI00355A53E1|nr:Vacuolar protein sorting 20A (Vps20A) [Monocercomonoides exilis]|eukprot:MONOS_775.1-p1 / transcript=MONOS_775.1 / gene=MONOS_775 / organism=Monocercomonoides_exilis_PA203 / gene_product= Vacuolar protein sorting 20A (Vps20A) / transcript_product= Vacuolar protein sorting 20A (Vps20A) / location=Mono_scaffold00013:74535-75432(-) / protein_length=223 / sequence_SO=supercontig / SO=protein_coding / is_pseudo=false
MGHFLSFLLNNKFKGTAAKIDSKQPPALNERDNQILDLKLARDDLSQRREQLYLNIDQEKRNAVNLFKIGRKDQAISCMKRKINYEKMIKVTSGYYDNISKLLAELEQSEISLNVVEMMESANEALSIALDDLDPDRIEELKAQIEEKNEKIDELHGVFEQFMIAPTDEEAEHELSLLNGQEVDLSEMAVPSSPIAINEETEGKVEKQSVDSCKGQMELEPA